MNTVRTYYRNAVMAFPHTCDYACALTQPASNRADKCVAWVLGVAAIVVMLSVMFVGPAV